MEAINASDSNKSISKHLLFDPADYLQNGSLIEVKKTAKLLLMNKKEF